VIYYSIIFLMTRFLIKIISDYSSEELEFLLNMLKMPELRLLCRTFRIPSTTEPKPKLIQALLQCGRSQQTISANQGGDSRAMIKSRYIVVHPIAEY
jgi:hypothetical protein